MKEESLSTSQKENKVKKILSSPMFLAVGINLIFFLLIVFFCDMKYEVSDDFIMASIMSGAYGDAPNPQMIFVNVIIGYLLLPLYYLFPQISWYFVAEVFLIFVSSTTVTYVLFEKLEKEYSEIQLSLQNEMYEEVLSGRITTDNDYSIEYQRRTLDKLTSKYGFTYFMEEK